MSKALQTLQIPGGDAVVALGKQMDAMRATYGAYPQATQYGKMPILTASMAIIFAKFWQHEQSKKIAEDFFPSEEFLRSWERLAVSLNDIIVAFGKVSPLTVLTADQVAQMYGVISRLTILMNTAGVQSSDMALIYEAVAETVNERINDLKDLGGDALKTALIVVGVGFVGAILLQIAGRSNINVGRR